MSSFVVGEYGKSADYDPFEIIVEEAHKRELSVHAWLNPLRGMTDEEIKKVPDEYKIREWFDEKNDAISLVEGRWYLDPANSEARELVSLGAAEIVRIYDVDGVHIDDYFYPTTEVSFDAANYGKYLAQGGEKELADFRRSNINELISELYSAVKAVREDVLFGISPAGAMKYNYNKLYADVAVWCENSGYIDYICPQIYFGFEHSTCDFKKLCAQFSDMIKVDGIRLIIGMTLGKAVSGYDPYAGEGMYEWRDNKDVLVRELKHTETIEKCSGVSYFCYQYFFDPVTGNEANNPAVEERLRLVPHLKNITWK